MSNRNIRNEQTNKNQGNVRIIAIRLRSLRNGVAIDVNKFDVES